MLLKGGYTMAGLNLSTDMLLMYLVRLMIILLINPLHEFAHAFTAHKLGDDTAKNRGRMTIDPIAHIEPFGALLLMLMGFGWAKPVPVNPANFKHRNRDMMLVSIAGPLSNLIAAFAGMAALQMCGGLKNWVDIGMWWCYTDGSSESYLAWMLYCFVDVNLLLCLFNLLPVPPLDGSRVLNYFLPPRASLWFMKNSRVFYGLMFFLMLTGILSFPLNIASLLIVRVMARIVSFLPVMM